MTWPTRAKRFAYLAHRWTGVAGCLLMLTWFLSGITMLFVGYPKLTPWERWAALPPLDPATCCATATGTGHDGATGLTLTSIAGTPSFVRHERSRLTAHAANGGQPARSIEAADALAEAAAFAPGGAWRYGGLFREDRWTHSRALDAHRPLHRVDGQGGSLYISSATGQTVLDAPLAQQRWNYVGAWLHWLYFLRATSVDPVWTWIVIVLSAAGTVAGVTGMLVGIWRWRFRGRYKSGAKSPYREGWMRWHHGIGLSFGTLACTWIFSGLMSMNPFAVFAAGAERPDQAAYRGAAATPTDPRLASPALVLEALAADGLRAVELHWHRLAGDPYVLAYDARGASRIVRIREERLAVTPRWEAEAVLTAAHRLFPRARPTARLIRQPDAYYYPRHPEAMNGAAPRGLPALRLDFDDAGHTRVYIDLRTGEPVLSLSRSQRVGRWLFYFLHSWDTPALLSLGALRDALLIALSLGGIALSVSGTVIGWRRLAISFRKRSPAW